MPRVTIVWAGDCAFDGKKYAHFPPPLPGHEHEDTDGMDFLVKPRTDTGPGDWAALFPGAQITAKILRGEHHFSMMRDAGAERLVELIREALVG